MDSRFVGATLAGMATIAVLGGLLYGVIFADYFQANMAYADTVMRDPPRLPWVALAHVPFGILLALVVRWRGDESAGGGATSGAILGFLMAASYDLSQYGTTDLWTLELTLVEPFITTVMIAGAGAVVGFILGAGRAGEPGTGA